MFTAPYNFVPLNTIVVRPSWAKHLSHDVPFQESFSGCIEMEMEAKSPVYIRQSERRKGKEEPKTPDFSAAPDGSFFIPGSSLKGAIRNVLEIMSFGDLSIKTGIEYAQKLAGKNSENKNPDLGECLFGFINKKVDWQQDEVSLKGRVIFSHAFVSGNAHLLPEKEVVLTSPNPDFYPSYIFQGKARVERYSKPEDSKAEIAGWKRYPVRKGNVIDHLPKQAKPDQKTKFKAMDEGAEFASKISFHNLSLIELGALLSAITFHGSANCIHSIGMAKPLGNGRMRVELKKLIVEKYPELKNEDCLKAFEAYISGAIGCNGISWQESNQMKHLASMVQPHKNDNDNHLKYSSTKQAKENGFALNRYPEYLVTLIHPFPSAFKMEKELHQHPCYKLGQAEFQQSIEFPYRKRIAIQKIAEEKGKRRKAEITILQMKQGPEISDLSPGQVISAQITSINGRNIEVQLFINSPVPLVAQVTANSIKKAEISSGKMLPLKEGMTIQVKLIDKVAPEYVNKVTFHSL